MLGPRTGPSTSTRGGRYLNGYADVEIAEFSGVEVTRVKG
jgi:hypothetical protein